LADVERIVILGSGPDVLGCRVWPRAGIDRIVAINNAWRVRPDWDHLVHPKDFPAERRPKMFGAGQSIHSHEDYLPAVNRNGGFVFCGGTMAFTAAYWVLTRWRPGLIAFFGCDMVYPAAGNSHFYGRGSADPLRSDPTLQSLEAKSMRFSLLAAREGCAVVNLGGQAASRLALPRIAPARLRSWDAGDSRRLVETHLGLGPRDRVAEILAAEAALGYEVPSGRYWKELPRFDAAALRRIDALWLDAGTAEAATA